MNTIIKFCLKSIRSIIKSSEPELLVIILLWPPFVIFKWCFVVLENNSDQKSNLISLLLLLLAFSAVIAFGIGIFGAACFILNYIEIFCNKIKNKFKEIDKEDKEIEEEIIKEKALEEIITSRLEILDL